MAYFGAIPRVDLQCIGIDYDIQTLQRDLQSYPLKATLSWLSSINLVLENEPSGFETDLKFRGIFLNDRLRQRIDQFEKSNEHGRGLVFTRQAVLVLMELARRHCNGPDSYPDANLKHNIGLSLLSVNSFLSSLEEFKWPDDRSEMLRVATPLLVRQILFNLTSQERYSAPRTWLVFNDLKEAAKPENAMDVSAELLRLRGYSIDDYLKTLLVLYSFWNRQTFKGWNNNYFAIDPKKIFERVNKDEGDRLMKVIESLTVEARTTAPLPNLKDHSKWRQTVYEFFEFRSKPLINIDGRYICSDFRLLLNRFWEGPYYEFLIHEKDRAKKDKLFHHLGDTTECYVRGLAENFFLGDFSQIKTPVGNPLGDGVIQIDKEWITVLEVKAGRTTAAAQSSDKAFVDIEDFRKLVKEALEQVSDRITEYRTTNRSTRITPIIITATVVPQNALLWELYLQEVGKLAVFNTDKVDFPILTDIEGYEVLMALKQINRFAEFLNYRLADAEAKFDHIRNLLYADFFKQGVSIEPPNELLIGIFGWLMNNLTKTLFGKELQSLSILERDQWRPKFKS